MEADGMCSLWIAERGIRRGQRGAESRSNTVSGNSRQGVPGRRLWTITPNKSSLEEGRKTYVFVDTSTLVGQAATYGETRWSHDRSSVAIVVRRLSGEVTAVIEIGNRLRDSEDVLQESANKIDNQYGRLLPRLSFMKKNSRAVRNRPLQSPRRRTPRHQADRGGRSHAEKFGHATHPLRYHILNPCRAASEVCPMHPTRWLF